MEKDLSFPYCSAALENVAISAVLYCPHNFPVKEVRKLNRKFLKIEQPGQDVRRFYSDLLLMLVPPSVMAWYFYGAPAVKRILLCAAAAVIFELLGGALLRCRICPLDLNSLFTGVAIALMLPSEAPYYVVLCGAAFAVFAVKLPFGGTGSAMFMPAAAAIAFLSLCFPDEVFGYATVSETGRFSYSSSLASMLCVNTSVRLNSINFYDIITGNIPGAMGTSCAVVLVGSAFILLFRQRRAALNTVGFLAACTIMALIFPRAFYGTDSTFASLILARLVSVLMELCSGMLLFAALFLVTDPNTSPSGKAERFVYGFLCGIACMLFRYFGRFEEGVCFSLLLMNALWPLVSDGLLKLCNSGKKKAEKVPCVTLAREEAVTDVAC